MSIINSRHRRHSGIAPLILRKLRQVEIITILIINKKRENFTFREALKNYLII